MFRIYPYRTGSKSVNFIKEALNGLSIRLQGSRYTPRDNHVIINWGNSRTPQWWGQGDAKYINSPESVAIASNKLSTFRALSDKGVSTVPWTYDKQVAQDWYDNGKVVFARHKLDGHSGDGIEVLRVGLNPAGELSNISDALLELGYDHLSSLVQDEIEKVYKAIPNAPLYTKQVPNAGEYRVHVFNNDIILYQKKSRRWVDEDVVDTPTEEQSTVRNLESGWVYRTGNLERLERVENLAIDAIKALGLDFGAVDIIMDNDGLVYVLEVNTAPGLGNTQTREVYTEAMMSLS